MIDKSFSQTEARLVADFLRVKFHIRVGNAFVFWRKTPEEVVQIVKINEPKIKLTAEDLRQAAGRNGA